MLLFVLLSSVIARQVSDVYKINPPRQSGCFTVCVVLLMNHSPEGAAIDLRSHYPDIVIMVLRKHSRVSRNEFKRKCMM